MIAQQEPEEYRITESELNEYARLKAHENSADFASLSKVHELSEKYESEIRARGTIQHNPVPEEPKNEKERLELYNELIASGLSDAEARGTAWPELNIVPTISPNDKKVSTCQTCQAEMAAFCSDCDRVSKRASNIRQHDAAIAAKAREEVLKDVVELTEAAASDNGIHQGWVLLAIVKGICKTCGNEPLRSEVKKG